MKVEMGGAQMTLHCRVERVESEEVVGSEQGSTGFAGRTASPALSADEDSFSRAVLAHADSTSPDDSFTKAMASNSSPDTSFTAGAVSQSM